LHEGIGGDGEQHAKLVGPEASATGAVEFHAELQLFDAILDLTARAVSAAIDGFCACFLLVTTKRGFSLAAPARL
jgi:hypothetical protein